MVIRPGQMECLRSEGRQAAKQCIHGRGKFSGRAHDIPTCSKGGCSFAGYQPFSKSPGALLGNAKVLSSRILHDGAVANVSIIEPRLVVR